MSSANCGVNPGYTFNFDTEGKCLITLERLNLLSIPTVTVNLAGVIDSEDIITGAIDANHLVNAVADQIITAVAIVGGDVGTTVQVDIQVKDCQGNNVSGNFVLDVWVHDSAGVLTPSGTAPTSSAISGTKGYIFTAIADGVAGRYTTDSTGLLTIIFTQAGALTRYLSVGVQGKIVSGSQAIIFTT